MTIHRIFEEIDGIELYAVQYEGEERNEYDRLMDSWTDVDHLRNYAKAHQVADVDRFVRQILTAAEEIDDFLQSFNPATDGLDEFFKPLSNLDSGIGKDLNSRKGRIDGNILRLYAIRLDQNFFLITGGAVKMSLEMRDHPDTERELQKIQTVRSYLKENGVFDDDSFIDFIQDAE